ncbi:MAG: ATP-dependent RNA helicase DbpA [Burkholderiaceae bacterium]|nr:ATP-dependent RNA helicase DbpA [Burkholderiaceae bacterium]
MTCPVAAPPAAAPAPTLAASDFARLPLTPAALANLQALGYRAMTPIQAAALPLALAGHDLIAQAATGSGKTVAFALALLARLDVRRPEGAPRTQALVLCPTRELAEQVTQAIRRLARAEDNLKVLALCGGSPIRPQLDSLAHGAQVVVGTPGRIVDHLGRGSLALSGLNTLVLDEADRMLDMGFTEDIAAIAAQCPKSRQTLLFSATWPEGVAQIGRRFLREPREVRLTAQPGASKIRQRFYEVTEDQRLHAVGLLLNHWRPARTLAFCNTKQQCRDLVAVLRAQGIAALALHGDLDQRDRDQVLVRFANRSCPVLVATDVAARGLDISGLEAVINVDVSPEAGMHVHRIGRTGRADAEGWAFTLASLDEMGPVGRIEALQGRPSEFHPLDELTPAAQGPLRAPMVTLQILGGRKAKIRPGDVLGALTGEGGLAAAQIGRIAINEFSTYVAVAREIAAKALRALDQGKVKGKRVKARALD